MPLRDHDDAEAGPISRPSSSAGSDLRMPPILPLSAFPDPGEPIHAKPQGYDFYRNVLKSPKLVVAPMVSGSELPWRILSRKFGADLCYSPMINSRSMVENLRAKGKTAKARVQDWFDAQTGEEGHGEDSQLIVQIAGNDPETVLIAAQKVQDHCLAVDLNLGCPQHIAKRGFYGSFLQENWCLIFRIINTLHRNLKVPVTAKMRVFPDVERTVAYAKMLAHAGAQIVTVHGRTREQKGHNTGLADWQKIKAVKDALEVPVFANGNVLYHEDIVACMKATGVDGVMSAEGNLYNPLIFASSELLHGLSAELVPYRSGELASFPYIPALAHAYLDEVVKCKTKTSGTAVKGHIFKICRPALEKHPELRAEVGKSRMRYDEGVVKGREGELIARERVVQDFRAVVKALDERLKEDQTDPRYASLSEDYVSSSLAGSNVKERYIPHWLAQPYIRPGIADGAEGGNNATKPEPAQPGAGGIINPQAMQSIEEKRVARETSSSDENDEKKKKLRQSLAEALGHKEAANAEYSAGRYDEAIGRYQDALGALPPRPEPIKADEESSVAGDASVGVDLGDKGKGKEMETEGKGKEMETEDNGGKSEGPQIRELSPAELAEEERLAALSPAERASEGEQRHLQREIKTLRITLHSNMAACEMKLERWDRGSKACDEALYDDPLHLKSLHRRATCLEHIGTWSSLSTAHSDLTRLLRNPQLPATTTSSVRLALSRVGKKRDEAAKREKDEMLSKLKSIGDSILGKFGLSTSNFKFEQNEAGGWGMKFQR